MAGIAPDAENLLDRLEQLSTDEIDHLPFGVIGFDENERVTIYNAFESALSGITCHRVIGYHFFTEVAPCTNNYLVAERYRQAEDVDETLDYVFTLRMRPTPVRLRLLAGFGAVRRYMIVVRPEQS